MKLSKNQFELLNHIISNKDKTFTQRELSLHLNLSLGTINGLISSLSAYLDNGVINKNGIK